MLRLFALALALTLLAGMAPAASPRPSPIRFSAEVSHSPMTLSDPLSIRIIVANEGSSRACVFGDLNYLITLRVFDSAGAEIHGPAHFETTPPPPKKASAFVCLQPGHSLSSIWRDMPASHGLTSPGTYSLRLEYRHTFSPQFTFGLPVWSGTAVITTPLTIR